MSKQKKVKKGGSKAASVKKPVKKVIAPVAKKSASQKPSKPSAAKKAAKKTVAKTKVVKKPVTKAAQKKIVNPPKGKVIVKKTIPAPAVKKTAAKSDVKAKATTAPKVKKEVKPVAPVKKTVNKSVEKTAQVVTKKTEEAEVKKSATEKRNTNDVLAISNTIPVKEAVVISPSRIASISRSITNPIKQPETYSVRPEKEPAGKFEMEFVVHASAEMLFEFLSTSSGLSEWFCDDLNIRNGIYTFIWEDTMQQARLLKTIDLQVVRFQWVDKTDGSYFEFRIQRDDLTNDISLIITDFAESPGDRESSKLLWQNQIEKLMHVIGSVF